MSFSRNIGTANLPKAGVACKHDLEPPLSAKVHARTLRIHSTLPQCILQILSGDTVWVVWRWPERDREVTERDVEEVLGTVNFPPLAQDHEDSRLTSIHFATSNSIRSTLSMANARRRLRGSFSPSARRIYPRTNSSPRFLRAGLQSASR